MELGFTSFKVSNPAHYDSGLAGLNQLEEHVAKARDTVGPDAELMLNPVMAYNVEFAVQVAERLRPYRLRWLEEPLVPSDSRGLLELKRAIPWMALATGEDHHGRHAFLRMIEDRSVDVVQPDMCWCGGALGGTEDLLSGRGSRSADGPAPGRLDSVRTALLVCHAGSTLRRDLAGVGPGSAACGGESVSRDGSARGRFPRAVRCTRLRNGDQRNTDPSAIEVNDVFKQI